MNFGGDTNSVHNLGVGTSAFLSGDDTVEPITLPEGAVYFCMRERPSLMYSDSSVLFSDGREV